KAVSTLNNNPNMEWEIVNLSKGPFISEVLDYDLYLIELSDKNPDNFQQKEKYSINATREDSLKLIINTLTQQRSKLFENRTEIEKLKVWLFSNKIKSKLCKLRIEYLDKRLETIENHKMST
ncbi:MAG: hypothetical protein MHPSP_001838, partial [Paramarteilia canceri]